MELLVDKKYCLLYSRSAEFDQFPNAVLQYDSASVLQFLSRNVVSTVLSQVGKLSYLDEVEYMQPLCTCI